MSPMGLSPTGIVLTASEVATFTTEIVPSPKFATYRNEPAALYATAVGAMPTVTVEFVLPPRIVILLLGDDALAPMVATATCLPEGLTATPMGVSPTAVVPRVTWFRVSIVVTVPSSVFVTYARLETGLNAMPIGPLPTSSLPTNLPSPRSTTATLAFEKSGTYAKGAAWTAPAASAQARRHCGNEEVPHESVLNHCIN